ncbi:hypothetical protein SGPA1_22044 [Streptomyces misionensis JCM 4497]
MLVVIAGPAENGPVPGRVVMYVDREDAFLDRHGQGDHVGLRRLQGVHLGRVPRPLALVVDRGRHDPQAITHRVRRVERLANTRQRNMRARQSRGRTHTLLPGRRQGPAVSRGWRCPGVAASQACVPPRRPGRA